MNILKKAFLVLLLFGISVDADLQAVKRKAEIPLNELEKENPQPTKKERCESDSEEAGSPDYKSTDFPDRFPLNPQISHDSSPSSLPQTVHYSYSINFMWINCLENKEQLYIHPSKDVASLYNDFLKPILKWAALNPNSVINVWYDGQFIPESAIINTEQLIQHYVSKIDTKMATIRLRDIRAIPKVVENSRVFNETPILFRVDLLRPVIALYIFEKNEADVFVYTDLDVNPLSEDQLFDEKTINKLKEYGMVMAQAISYENGFQIIYKHHECMFESIKWALIELNIQRAYNALEGRFKKHVGEGECILCSLENIAWAVFRSYANVLVYCLFLEGYAKLQVRELGFTDDGGRDRSKDKIWNYDKNKDGLNPFGVEVEFCCSVREFSRLLLSSYEKEGKKEEKLVNEEKIELVNSYTGNSSLVDDYIPQKNVGRCLSSMSHGPMPPGVFHTCGR